MALLALLNSKITVYSDDYWYGTFFQNGFSGFLREMYQHYMQTNGRLYVHAIIPVVLLFDTKLFIFLSPVLLAALYAMGAKALMRSSSSARYCWRRHSAFSAHLRAMCGICG